MTAPIRGFADVPGWCLDTTLTGFLALPAALATIGATITAIEHRTPPPAFLYAVAWGAPVGGLVGLVLGLGSSALVWWTWARSPAVALLVGPALGGGGAVLAFEALSLGVDGRFVSEGEPLAVVSTLGVLAVGPSWVGYLSLRGRGRSGRPMIPATVVWAAATSLLTSLGLWARSHL